MSGQIIFENIFSSFVNQPISIGIGILVYGIMHQKNDDAKWKSHDAIAEEFKLDMRKKTSIVEKVEKYMMKFEDDESIAKRERVDHIITVAKNSVSIIIQQYINYFENKENGKKTEQENFNEILEMTTANMNDTWTRLLAQGYHYDVKLMKKVSDMLMPKYSEELHLICHIYNSEGLNGAKTKTLLRLIQAFEAMVCNSWDDCYRKLAYA